MSQSQKEFEVFANHWRYDLTQNEEGFYVHALTQRVWDSWCASRKAQVVELPCWSEYDSPRQYMDAVKQQLDELSIKYTDR
jgi:hypothetical protein